MDIILRIIRALIDDPLQKDGLNVHTVTDPNDLRFDITEPIIVESTITVLLNGDPLAEGYWDYDSDIGKIVFNEVTGFDLAMEDSVEIRYHYYRKYSDDAIRSYIEASFPYFVTYKYPKTFEIDIDGELVATNNAEPTIEEKYLIALVTSVVIEPTELNITTPDFSFRSGAGDRRTLDEKISTIFRHSNRAKGIIEFLDIDC